MSPSAVLQHARDQVYERGYAVIPDVFTAADTAPVAATAMQVGLHEMQRDPSPFTVDHGTDGLRRPRKVDYPFQKHPAFREFILDRRITDLAAAVLGEPAYLMRDQLFCKPPHFGTAKPYHQENASTGYQPADSMIITWIALDDATSENGCLRVIDDSHRTLWPHRPQPDAVYNHVPPPEAVDLDREVLLPVPAGGVVVLHSQVLHYSAANHSEHWRRAYTGHWVTAGITCTTDAQRYGYSRTAGGGERLSFRAP
ncbi:phytanoyl-CoA dioxygenase family protein [Nocardia pneumoniae]|uniref:phytanoyl-CoA dioxygenase family protein n=1 Tax=Nocardia pneumoniae TaxID=228601 RepID=UPI0002E85429|nr:phytanoyl-CoA dioxygenase family protein [Nocardia pneumoniae]